MHFVVIILLFHVICDENADDERIDGVLEKIKEELESMLHIPIDIVNFRSSLRDTLKQNILKDAVYI